MSRRISSAIRTAVEIRAANCCEYCRSQVQFALQAFSIEYIIPVSQGGETALENLALACQGCNNHKYNKISAIDPLIGQMTGLFNPRQQVWNEHFAWNEDCSLAIGLTPIGRATVEALKLNRSGVVNLRKLLKSINRHPPD